MYPRTCTWDLFAVCRSKCSTTAAGRRRWAGSPTSLDTPAALEPYRSRYPDDRQPTFDAYVDVFFRVDGARDLPGGWSKFSRCANDERALRESEPELVRRAEGLMRVGGYEADDSGRTQGRGRRWVKTSTG
jgi:hypothetical protein